MQSNTTTNRFTYFKALWKEGLWEKWLSIPWNAWGVFSFIRDELWRPSDEGKGRIINMIPHLSLAWWLVGAFIIIIIWLFEASFRHTKKLDTQIEELSGEKEKPHFDMDFAIDVYKPYPSNRDSIVEITGHITNTGTPSIIKDIEVGIKIDNKLVQGKDLPSKFQAIIDGKPKTVIIPYGRELLSKHLTIPIVTGGGAIGSHFVLFPNVSIKRISRAGTIIIVFLQDVFGKHYTFKKVMDKYDIHLRF